MGVAAKRRSAGPAAVLIAPNRKLADQFVQAVAQTHAFEIVADLKQYPSEAALDIRLRQHKPEAVLLDVSADLEAACELIRHLVSMCPPVPVVGLDASSRPEVVMRVLRLGGSEFLAAPFDPQVQKDAAGGLARSRVAEVEPRAEPGKIIAFASAKPGSGASVLACQTAFALHRATGRSVLLADLDLSGGSVGFYTGVKGHHSFLSALEQADCAETSCWQSLVASFRGVDVLPGPATPSPIRAEPMRLRQVLDQARSTYDWAILDLPAIFHQLSLLALTEADRTFLIATTELPSLHAARRAVDLIGQIGIGRDRFEVLLNQVGKRGAMSDADLERVLNCPVRTTLPDDHSGLLEAVALGQPVRADSSLGKAIDGLASRLAGTPQQEKCKADFYLGPGPVLAGA